MTTQMNMGDVSRRLGLIVTSELLQQLGIPITPGKGRAVYVDEKHWQAICAAVADYVLSRKNAKPVPKPPKADAAPAATAGDDDDEL